ncbi:MAG: hypothetical protein WBE41_15155 [Terracidiphilus sp.]
MIFALWTPSMRRVLFSGAAAVLAASFASAQSQVSSTQSSTAAYSASNESSSLEVAGLASPASNPDEAAALPAAPVPAAGGHAAAGQEYGGKGGWKHYVGSKFAFEAGGGVNAPAGDKTYVTWGGQFTVGAGLNFTKRFATLIEYQFLDAKLPGAIIAEAGAQGGHDHIWSLTLDPVISLFPKSSNDVYVTGGGGFYRKVTSFTDVEPTEYCQFYYCGVGYTPQVVGHFSSNQGGFNIGGGYQHRMGGLYGDSKMRLFAEVRYLDVLSPAVTTQPNGLGTTSVAADTKVLPISLGVRW